MCVGPLTGRFGTGFCFFFCAIPSSSSCLGILKLLTVLHSIDYYSSLFTNLQNF